MNDDSRRALEYRQTYRLRSTIFLWSILGSIVAWFLGLAYFAYTSKQGSPFGPGLKHWTEIAAAVPIIAWAVLGRCPACGGRVAMIGDAVHCAGCGAKLFHEPQEFSPNDVEELQEEAAERYAAAKEEIEQGKSGVVLIFVPLLIAVGYGMAYDKRVLAAALVLFFVLLVAAPVFLRADADKKWRCPACLAQLPFYSNRRTRRGRAFGYGGSVSGTMLTGPRWVQACPDCGLNLGDDPES